MDDAAGVTALERRGHLDAGLDRVRYAEPPARGQQPAEGPAFEGTERNELARVRLASIEHVDDARAVHLRQRLDLAFKTRARHRIPVPGHLQHDLHPGVRVSRRVDVRAAPGRDQALELVAVDATGNVERTAAGDRFGFCGLD